MRALLYDDTFPRLVRNWQNHPGKWISRLVFLLGPWVCLWMVEILMTYLRTWPPGRC